MRPHKLTFLAPLCLVLTINSPSIQAQKQKVPTGGRFAIVVDERLSALRAKPDLAARLIRRLGRGRFVAIKSARKSRDGVVFFLVNASRRTQGWIQREAVVVPSRRGEDTRLMLLMRASADFDRITRARILLDYFPKSSLLPEALLMLADTAEQVSSKLSREAERRMGEHAPAPEFSLFLNYSGLDRYNRQGVGFIFDQRSRRLHYDGSAWREIVRRFPRSPQAQVAQTRLSQLSMVVR